MVLASLPPSLTRRPPPPRLSTHQAPHHNPLNQPGGHPSHYQLTSPSATIFLSRVLHDTNTNPIHFQKRLHHHRMVPIQDLDHRHPPQHRSRPRHRLSSSPPKPPRAQHNGLPKGDGQTARHLRMATTMA